LKIIFPTWVEKWVGKVSSESDF